MLAESKTLTPNHALRQAIEQHIAAKPSLKQLQQTALNHKSLELVIKMREEELARVNSTPGNPAENAFAKRSPEEVKKWLISLDLEECLKPLLDNG